jgi:hypothetical protein
MTNWEFFKYNNKYIKNWLKLPRVTVINESERMNDEHLSKCPEAIGIYYSEYNKIVIIEGNNNFAVRFHEYGHWINAVIFCLLEVFWEFLWWGLSIRNLFVKKEA